MKASDFLQLATLTIVIATALILIPSRIQAKQGRHDKGTIFSFHFDEGKGKNAEDFSGNENHAKLGGNKEPKWVNGPEPHFGKALAFKGANFIEIAPSDKLDTDDAITFEAWVKLDVINASWATLYSKNSQSANLGFHWIYIYKDGGRLAYQYATGAKYVTHTADVKWEFGKWTHVAITHKIDGKKGGKIEWYINAERLREVEHKDVALKVIGGKASLGTYQSNPAHDRYALDGALDEVRLSPRVKTAQEIKESMLGLAVEPSDKVATTWGGIKQQF